MDPYSCNYNPNANFSVPSLCCYPGYCNDRDIAFVCQEITGIDNQNKDFVFDLYPVPADNVINLKLSVINSQKISYFVYDALGRLLKEQKLDEFNGDILEQIDISAFESGLYYLRLQNNKGYSESKKFIIE